MQDIQMRLFKDSDVFQKERPDGLTSKQESALLKDLVEEAKEHLDLWVNRNSELDSEILLDLEEIDILRTAYSCAVVVDTIKGVILYHEYFVSFDASDDRDLDKDTESFKAWVKTIAERVTEGINNNVAEWKAAQIV